MQIIPDPQVMLAVFIVFMITMFALTKLVFKPLIAYMDDRDNKISSDLKLATSDDKELEKIEQQIKDIIAEAKAKANSIRETQMHEAKELAQAKIAQTRAENKEKMDSLMARLNDEREQMKAQFKASLGDLDSVLTAKVKNI